MRGWAGQGSWRSSGHGLTDRKDEAPRSFFSEKTYRGLPRAVSGEDRSAIAVQPGRSGGLPYADRDGRADTAAVARKRGAMENKPAKCKADRRLSWNTRLLSDESLREIADALHESPAIVLSGNI